MADSYLLGASAGASVGYTIAVLYVSSALTIVGLGIAQTFAFIFALLTVFLVLFISRVGTQNSHNYPAAFRCGCEHFSFGYGNTYGASFRASTHGDNCLARRRILRHRLAPSMRNIPIRHHRHSHNVLFHPRPKHAFHGRRNRAASWSEHGKSASTPSCHSFFDDGCSGRHQRCHRLCRLDNSAHDPAGRLDLTISILLPASAVVGAMFLVICDAVARVATGASELPVGVITALVGTPFFIYLLRRRKTTYSL